MDGIVMMTADELERTHGDAIRKAAKERQSARRAMREEQRRFTERLQQQRSKAGGSIITRSEAAMHCRPGDGYIIIGGSVYDISNHVEVLPCGPHHLKPYLGMDATNAFKDNGHSLLAKFQLADLYVGDLPLVENIRHSQPGDTSSDEDGRSSDDEESESAPKRAAPDTSSSAGARDDDKHKPPPQVRRRVANRYRKPGDQEFLAATNRGGDKEEEEEKERPAFRDPSEVLVAWGGRAVWVRLRAQYLWRTAVNTAQSWWMGRDKVLRAWPLILGMILFIVSAAHIRLPPLTGGSGVGAGEGLDDRGVGMLSDGAASESASIGGGSQGRADEKDSPEGHLGWPLITPWKTGVDAGAGKRDMPEGHDPKAVMYF